MTRLKWMLVSVHLEMVLILSQDRSTVGAEHTIGSESFWTHPMVLTLMQDRYMVCAKHTMGSEIILGTRNVTPR